MAQKSITKQDVRTIVKDVVSDAIEEFAIIIKKTFDHYDDRIDKRFAEQTAYIDKKNKETQVHLTAYIDKKTEETKRHFDAVAENIHQDLAGANKDEIGLIKDKQENHEDRLVEVERRVALR